MKKSADGKGICGKAVTIVDPNNGKSLQACALRHPG